MREQTQIGEVTHEVKQLVSDSQAFKPSSLASKSTPLTTLLYCLGFEKAITWFHRSRGSWSWAAAGPGMNVQLNTQILNLNQGSRVAKKRGLLQKRRQGHSCDNRGSSGIFHSQCQKGSEGQESGTWGGYHGNSTVWWSSKLRWACLGLLKKKQLIYIVFNSRLFLKRRA